MNTINEAFAVLQVFKSNEYSKIGFFIGNRFCGGKGQKTLTDQQGVDFEKRVKKMMKKLSDEGFDPMQFISCVIIANQLLAIDGQTRLEACRRLGIAFYYTILPVLDEKVAYKLFFDLNNSGTKWTVTDKTVSNIFNPNLTKKQQDEQRKIVNFSTKYKIAISNVKYVAHGQNSNKQEKMTNFDLVCAPDTEQIFKLCEKIAINSNLGTKMLNKDKFIRSVARMYRNQGFSSYFLSKIENALIDFDSRSNTDAYYLSTFQEVLNKGLHNKQINLIVNNNTINVQINL